MKNIFKIILLATAGIFFVTYLTANQPEEMNKSSEINYESLPQSFELVGKDDDIKRGDLFKKSKKALIVVGSHDSLPVIQELPKHFELNIPYVLVANISSAPWFVKKMFIPSKLEDINKNSNIPMIYDFDGDMIKALKIVKNAKTEFIAFLLDENGAITRIHSGSVKEGALDGSMNEAEKKEALKPLYELVK